MSNHPSTLTSVSEQADLDATDLASQPALGKALKRVRREKRVSLTAVAKGTGISASFLSVVENGRSDISVGRLIHLLRFYGVRLNDLFPEEAANGRIVITPEERKHLDVGAQGIEIFLLAPDTNRTMMPVIGFWEPGANMRDIEPHDGEVFGFVVKGSLLFEREGHDPVVLREGSSVYWPGSPAPRLCNIADGESVLLAVISPPTL